MRRVLQWARLGGPRGHGPILTGKAAPGPRTALARYGFILRRCEHSTLVLEVHLQETRLWLGDACGRNDLKHRLDLLSPVLRECRALLDAVSLLSHDTSPLLQSCQMSCSRVSSASVRQRVSLLWTGLARRSVHPLAEAARHCARPCAIQQCAPLGRSWPPWRMGNGSPDRKPHSHA